LSRVWQEYSCLVRTQRELPVTYLNLLDAAWILNPCTKQGPVLILRDVAPRILSAISRHTRFREESSRAGVRGPVNWSKTFSRRAAEPGSFVCSRRVTDFDTPQNGLLRYLLVEIERQTHSIPQSVRRGSVHSACEKRRRLDVNRHLNWIRDSARQFLVHPSLRNVSDVSRRLERVLLSARSSRNHEYRILAKFAADQISLEAKEKVARSLFLIPESLKDGGEEILRALAYIHRNASKGEIA
jgi:hypothetical protein